MVSLELAGAPYIITMFSAMDLRHTSITVLKPLLEYSALIMMMWGLDVKTVVPMVQ